MKNSTFTIEEIKRLESMSRSELIKSFKEYDEYTTHSLALFTNITTIDKAVYVGIMLRSMKAKEICEETGLSKSNVSRLGKVGKWALSNKEQYKALVDTSGTSLSVRLICDAITHNTIEGVKDWASLVKAEEGYKASTKATSTPTGSKPTTSTPTGSKPTQAKKPTSDKATPTTSPTPTTTQKHAFKIIDFERMNSTAMYSAIIRLCDAYKASGDDLEYMNSFIARLNELKH